MNEQAPEPIVTLIPADEARELMTGDALGLLMQDIMCPLARKIEEAIAALDRAIDAHRPE